MANVTVGLPSPPADVLRRLEVRPIRPEERAAWDALVRDHRYLGLQSLLRKTLR
jgi:hypothetical protein